MKRFLLIFFILSTSAFGDGFVQPEELRQQCKLAQKCESKITKLLTRLREISEKKRMSVPIIHDIYEMLSRCCSVLCDIQNFSDLLVLKQNVDKSDFINCSIIVKNCANYFQAVGAKLSKGGLELSDLEKEKTELETEYKQLCDEYKKLVEGIEKKSEEISKNREENVIQDDVVYHLAVKSESLEELDAELEAESVVGVLKSSGSSSSELKLGYPVSGKIVAEFGDKGVGEEMIYYLGFETAPGAIVTSPAKGKIVFAGKFLNYGNMVIISRGMYRVFLYGMKKIFVATGDVLEIGDYVGMMDEESKEAPILKIELKKSGEPLDPRHWLLQTIKQEEKK
ncbi:MAG: peptidoglycan DD-metalloendopeptidase family protein [Alphaproteobacteria bacterium]|nr:peptidoglycan DD-metalloendopeptidase family protein [Alphaproteobacteria bacterium]